MARRITTTAPQMLALAVLVAFATVTGSEGSDTPGVEDGVVELVSPSDLRLGNPHFDVLIVAAEEVGTEPTTNGNPPRGRFRVEEVLRGRVAAQSVDLVWRPPNRPRDHVLGAPGEPMYGRWYRQPLKPEWYDRPLPGPSVGDTILVFCVFKRESVPREVVAVFEPSDRNRATVLGEMAPPERSAAVQRTLALAIIICVHVAISSVIRAHRSRETGKRQFYHGLGAVVSAVVGLAGYWVYEAGVSPWTNIRIDLLFMYPVVALAALSAVGGLVFVVRGAVAIHVARSARLRTDNK